MKIILFSFVTVLQFQFVHSQLAGKIGVMTPFGAQGYFLKRTPTFELSYLSNFSKVARFNAFTNVSFFSPRKESYTFYELENEVFVPYNGTLSTQPQITIGVGVDFRFYEEDNIDIYGGFSILGIYKSSNINLPNGINKSNRELMAGNTFRTGMQYNVGSLSYILEGSLYFQWLKQPRGGYGGLVSFGVRYNLKNKS